ncbi:MAG: hypothetical protein LBR12_01710 [Opitutaceae bacterium]|jgi:hypothetical protein|nr:hypothetical protein [Opitutaceae bacterium]
MSATDEDIVREYFEQNGFLTRQVRKYQVQSRKKTGGEAIDFLVHNPAWRPSGRPDFFLFAGGLPRIRRAVVSVRPWHTGVFTPTLIRATPELFDFLGESALREAARGLPDGGTEGGGDGGLVKILVIPGLPAREPFRAESAGLLKERGVDAVLSFRSLLLDLIARVEVNLNYRKSDTLQLLRILKNYDLLRDAQLELPDRPRR